MLTTQSGCTVEQEERITQERENQVRVGWLKAFLSFLGERGTGAGSMSALCLDIYSDFIEVPFQLTLRFKPGFCRSLGNHL